MQISRRGSSTRRWCGGSCYFGEKASDQDSRIHWRLSKWVCRELSGLAVFEMLNVETMVQAFVRYVPPNVEFSYSCCCGHSAPWAKPLGGLVSAATSHGRSAFTSCAFSMRANSSPTCTACAIGALFCISPPNLLTQVSRERTYVVHLDRILLGSLDVLLRLLSSGAKRHSIKSQRMCRDRPRALGSLTCSVSPVLLRISSRYSPPFVPLQMIRVTALHLR